LNPKEAFSNEEASFRRTRNMFSRKGRITTVVDFSNEREMVLALSQGNQAVLSHLYAKYNALFFTIANRYSTNTQEAEDYVQDAFVQIYKKADTFNFKGSFEGWMKRILINICLSALRKNKILLDDPIEDLGEFDKYSENNWTLENMSANEILLAIDELPIGCKTVLNLNVLEGYNHKEIGEKLGITESASRSQLTKARAKLKVLLKQKNLIEK